MTEDEESAEPNVGESLREVAEKERGGETPPQRSAARRVSHFPAPAGHKSQCEAGRGSVLRGSPGKS